LGVSTAIIPQDMVVLSLVLAALVYVGIKKAFFGDDATEPAGDSFSSKTDVDESDFVSKMAATEKSMVVFFGSQVSVLRKRLAC
jgi:hypothetical protein